MLFVTTVLERDRRKSGHVTRKCSWAEGAKTNYRSWPHCLTFPKWNVFYSFCPHFGGGSMFCLLSAPRKYSLLLVEVHKIIIKKESTLPQLLMSEKFCCNIKGEIWTFQYEFNLISDWTGEGAQHWEGGLAKDTGWLTSQLVYHLISQCKVLPFPP